MRGLQAFIAITLFIYASALHGQSDTVRVAHQREYWPYCFVSLSGQSEGILIDWWTLFGKKQLSLIQFVPCELQECIALVQSGNADAIAGLFADAGQMDSLIFGDPIMQVRTELFLRKGLKPQSVYQITDTLGVLESSAAMSFIQRDYGRLPIKYYKSILKLIEDIEDQSLAGFFYEKPAPNTNIEIEDGLEVSKKYYKYLELRTDRLRPALRKDNVDLFSQIQIASSSITRDELLQIAAKHNIKPIDPVNPWPLMITITLGFVIILSALVLRLRQSGGNLTKSKDHWASLIRKGETDKVEFKSSLRYDYREQKANKALEYVIVKTLSAFLNTTGGVLLIGVDDDGEVLGLEKDYEVLNKPNSDAFLLVFTNLINKHFGKNAHRSIKASIVNLNRKEICVIEVQKSDDPVFLKKGEKEEFYIRAAAASVPLGFKEATNYIRKHW